MLTPEERGPQAAWAYASRDLLGISPEQVVAFVGRYDPATIRKAETNDRHMSRPIWRALTALYPRLAHERGVAIPIPPVVPGGRGATPPDPTGLAAAIERQVAAISDLVEEMRLARQEQAAMLRGIERALSLAATGQAGAASGAPSGPRVHEDALR